MHRIYLDHQATTPVSPAVINEMRRHLLVFPGNPHSSDHAAGWEAADALDVARTAVAEGIGAIGDEIVFTSGATEANNLAILGIGPPTGGRNRIVVSAIEHSAVIAPARELARRGFEIVTVPCSADGVVDEHEFRRVVDERTLLACLMLVNNEIGTVQPVAQVAERCRKVGAMLHVDAAQALRWMPLDVVALGCTSLGISAHKIGGPPGIGALWIDGARRGAVAPLQHGGEQEGGLRPGTTPAFLAAGFAQAVLDLPDAETVADWRSVTEWAWSRLQEEVPGIRLNGGEALRHPGTLNVRLPDVAADLVIAALQPRVALSQGSACTSGTPEPSHVLRAMGLSASETRDCIRISTSPDTTRVELSEFVPLLSRAVSRVRAI